MKSVKMSFFFLALIFLFTLSSTAFAQRRVNRRAPTANSGHPTGEQEAARFWRNYVAACNGSYYVKKTPSVFVELRGFNIRMRYDPITEADKLNGVEAKGKSWFEASAYRIYSKAQWHQWGNGMPDDMTLVNWVMFKKVRGRWSFYNEAYFRQFANSITCSDLPGHGGLGGNSTPTNSIALTDNHHFPITNFTFWNRENNEKGSRFLQYNTNVLNWVISTQGTAFFYSLNNINYYWYKDGKVVSSGKEVSIDSSEGKIWGGAARNWEAGIYTVKVYQDGRLIATGNFEIIADRTTPNISNTRAGLRFGGLYRLNAETVDPNNKRIIWLRFYRKGTVLLLSTDYSFNLRDVADCFESGSTCHNVSRWIYDGKYSISGDAIYFTVRGHADDWQTAPTGILQGNAVRGEMKLQGFIKANALELGNEQKRARYEFIRIENRNYPDTILENDPSRFEIFIAEPSLPSSYKTYNEKLFQVNVPDNWKEIHTNKAVWFFPVGGYSSKDNIFTHGIGFGVVSVSSTALRQVADELLNTEVIRSWKPYLSQPEYRSIMINGRDGLAATFSRMNVVTGYNELVTFYVTRLRNNRIFYMESISPLDRVSKYGSLFQKILDSIKLND